MASHRRGSQKPRTPPATTGDQNEVSPVSILSAEFTVSSSRGQVLTIASPREPKQADGEQPHTDEGSEKASLGLLAVFQPVSRVEIRLDRDKAEGYSDTLFSRQRPLIDLGPEHGRHLPTQKLRYVSDAPT